MPTNHPTIPQQDESVAAPSTPASASAASATTATSSASAASAASAAATAASAATSTFTSSSPQSPTSTNQQEQSEAIHQLHQSHQSHQSQLLEQQQRQQRQQQDQHRQQLLKLQQIQQQIETNKKSDCRSDEDEVMQLLDQHELNRDEADNLAHNSNPTLQNAVPHLSSFNYNNVDTYHDNIHDSQIKRPALSSRSVSMDTTQNITEYHHSPTTKNKSRESTTSAFPLTSNYPLSKQPQHPYLKNMAALRSKQKFSLDHFESNRRVFKTLSHSHTNHHNYHQQQQYPPSSFHNPYLQPNASFIGEQQSGKSKFRIKVEFKTVDMKNSLVTGFLQINGLTKDHQEIVTYFRGEIINNPLYSQHQQQSHRSNESSSSNTVYDDEYKRFSFMAENKNWGSSVENDLDHWKRLTQSPASPATVPTFPTLHSLQYSTCPYASSTNTIPPYSSSSRSTNHAQNKEFMNKLAGIYQGQCGNDEYHNQYVYMRWKEEFLLPDSRVKQIPNASFEGFYYIVLNIGSNQIMDESALDADINGERSSADASNHKKSRARNDVSGTGTTTGTPVGGSKPGDINGLYYHMSSEKFQSLSLSHVDDHGVSSTFDFN
ncbi:hypothetical protein KGF57_001252 [Candida theae]|uniref:Uncharacterized protein n=1 Tax=Candida theae TaxID=1198502 RepID=A0AAD5BHW2_9ASCO|nr:uncharacterized protein KGF57_001252 [Candida theae]KAI5963423.1 hypothetical protein KGF57_001252 [Candida theae]